MLRCAIFSPDSVNRGFITAAVKAFPGLLVLKIFDRFLDTGSLLDYVRAHSPQILFFDVSHGCASLHEAAVALTGFSQLHIVAIDRHLEAEVLLDLMNAGVREFLQFPFEADKLASTVARIEAAFIKSASAKSALAMSISGQAPEASDSTDLLFCFLPGKPGCGASMTALHTALELANRPNNRVLFADFDLNCGSSRFLMKLTNPLGIRDALASAATMDDELWKSIVSRYDDLDLLPTGLIDPFADFGAAEIRSLFNFARRRYRILLADLSGAMEPFSLDIFKQSRRILLVVEPNLSCVYQAREKLRYLEDRELRDRVGLVINKWRKDSALTIADVENVLGIPTEATLSDSPEQIYKSTLRGGALDPASSYFREIADLASTLASDQIARSANKVKRKPDYFSIMPSRYAVSRS